MSAIALMAFASCEKQNDDLGDDEIVEDGFYVVGEATGSDNIQADYMMAAGFNEVDKAKRDGMYEKYVALEAGKTFNLAIYEAGEITYFGAELADMDLTGLDNNPGIVIKRGALQSGETAPKMSVAESGLYHIVLDLNNKKDLNTALIIIAPARWGVRGDMNGWGYTPMEASEFNTKTMTYTVEGATVVTDGGFKFASEHGWKLNMDDAGNVKAEIGLGNDATEDNLELMPNGLVQYGKNIKIARGVYTITLTWKLAGGALQHSFTATMTKTGNPAPVDYSECIAELVGSGVVAQEGAIPDEYWTWGNALSAGKPAKNGDVYTWTWEGVELSAEGWKIRSLNGAESGGQNLDLGNGAVDRAASPNVQDSPDGNIYVTAGTYNITLVADETAGTKTITIVEAK